jgi:hypothetical protein
MKTLTTSKNHFISATPFRELVAAHIKSPMVNLQEFFFASNEVWIDE